MKNFSRKTKLKSNLIASTLIVIGIIIVINIIGYKLFYRIDLTQNKEFSLSAVTKAALKNLDDIVNIKVYFSEKLPPQYISITQEVKDVLEEYQNFSRGKLKISYIDPKDDIELQAEARRLQIPQIQFNIVEKDQFQVTQGYLGLAVMYGDKKEVLPVIEDTKNLEYKLTAAIKKIMSDKTGKIGFTKGHDEPSAEEERPGAQNMLKEFLRQQFNVVSVDTTRGEPIADDINTLVINGPKQAFTDRELYLVDQFLMAGKSIFFLLDGVTLDEGLVAKTNNTNLEKLLAHYGINFENNLVLDVSNDLVGFNDGKMGFMAPYPFWIRALKNNFDSNSVIVNHLETMLLPWVSSMTINKDVVGDNEFSELIKTTDKAWTQNENYNLNPTQNFSPPADSLRQHTLAVAVSGKFNSYFAGKKVPPQEEDETEIISADTVIDSTANGRIVVIGDSEFITKNILKRSKSNLLFFQNVIDVLTQDENLVAIRAKGSSERPIKDITDQRKTFLKFINIFGVSILVVIIGVLRFVARRKDNKREF